MNSSPPGVMERQHALVPLQASPRHKTVILVPLRPFKQSNVAPMLYLYRCYRERTEPMGLFPLLVPLLLPCLLLLLLAKMAHQLRMGGSVRQSLLIS